MKSLRERIEEVFRDSTDPPNRWLELFVTQVHGAHLLAEDAMYHSLIRFFIAWFVVYAVGAGLVTEGEIAAVKVEKIKELLIVGPPLLGFFGYAMANATFSAFTLRDAIGAIYEHALPVVKEHELETLIATPTFVGAEQTLMDGTAVHKVFAWAVVVFVLAVLVLGPIAAVLHAGWLIWKNSSWSAAAAVSSTAVGLVLWIRSVLLVNRALTI